MATLDCDRNVLQEQKSALKHSNQILKDKIEKNSDCNEELEHFDQRTCIYVDLVSKKRN